MRAFEISPHQFGLLVSAYTLSAGFSGLLAACFIDSFDRKRALQVMYIGFGIGTVWCGLSANYPTLLLARGITGVFGGVLGTLVLSIIGDVISASKRGAAMGIVMTSFSLASVLGVPLGLFIATHFNWNAPFLALGGLSLVISALVASFVPALRGHLSKRAQLSSEGSVSNVTQSTDIQSTEIQPPEIQSRDLLRPFRQALSNSDQRFSLVLILLLMFGQFSVIPFISAFLVSNCGFPEDHLSFVYLAGGLATIVSGPAIGKAIDRIGIKPMLLSIIIFSCVPIIAITNLGPTSLVLVLVVTTLFFIFSSGRMIGAQTLISMTVHPAERGGFMSIVNAMQQTGAAIGSYISGVIITRGEHGLLEHYPTIGYISVVCTLVSAIVASKIKGTIRERAEVLTEM